VRRRLRELGGGATGLYTGIGPKGELIGRRPADLAQSSASRVRATLASLGQLRHMRRASGVVPAQIAGDLTGGPAGARRALAVAVNGRIEAVGWSFHLDGDTTEHYSVMVPESTLHDGRNDVRVYQVTRAGSLRLLARS
jgi:hypothetical protein